MTGLTRWIHRYPQAHPRLSQIYDGVRCVGRIKFADVWVRDMPADVLRRGAGGAGGAAPDLLWTDGFRTRHNRFVRLGAFPAYHLSNGVTTASAEVFGGTPSPTPVLGVPPASRLQLTVRADVREVLDLTDASVRAALGVRLDELREIPDWSSLDALDRPSAYELPQLIGEVAHDARCGGILYPAARATNGVNLVVFTRHLARLGGTLSAEDPTSDRVQTLP